MSGRQHRAATWRSQRSAARENSAAYCAGADAELLRDLSQALIGVVQLAGLRAGGEGEGLAAHLDPGIGGDLGDGGSVDSKSFGDLLHGHSGCVGVEELLTLRVAQTGLRFQGLGCDWTALIASGESFGSSGGGLGSALTRAMSDLGGAEGFERLLRRTTRCSLFKPTTNEV